MQISELIIADRRATEEEPWVVASGRPIHVRGGNDLESVRCLLGWLVHGCRTRLSLQACSRSESKDQGEVALVCRLGNAMVTDLWRFKLVAKDALMPRSHNNWLCLLS